MLTLFKTLPIHRTALEAGDFSAILLNAANYKAYADFRVRALDVAVDEINELSDLTVSYEAIKQGRSFGSVEFKTSIKLDLDERFAAWKKIQDVIGK